MIHITEDQIQSIVRRLAGEIKTKHPDQNITLLGVLDGAAPFACDLARHFSEDVILGFTKVKSYNGTKSTGNIQMVLAPTVSIAGSNIVVIEDIIDTGRTMNELVYTLRSKGAKTVEVCTFLDRPSKREVKFTPDYVGTKLNDDDFVIGYGMDYKGHARTLGCIRTITDEELKKW